MIRAKHFKKLAISKNDIKTEYNDVVLIPSWLLKSIIDYDNELLTKSYNSLSDYEKGIVDTLKKQQDTLSINLDR